MESRLYSYLGMTPALSYTSLINPEPAGWSNENPLPLAIGDWCTSCVRTNTCGVGSTKFTDGPRPVAPIAVRGLPLRSASCVSRLNTMCVTFLLFVLFQETHKTGGPNAELRTGVLIQHRLLIPRRVRHVPGHQTHGQHNTLCRQS